MALLVRENRREFLRRSAHLPCECVRESDFRRVGVKLLDLSLQGALVESEIELAAGDSVLLTFRDPRTSLWFDLEADVSRVIRARRKIDRGLAVGIQFRPMRNVSRLILSQSLRRMPPPVPRRVGWEESRARIDYAETVRRIAAGGLSYLPAAIS